MPELGYTPESPEPSATSPPEKPKVQYPSFDLRDENVDKIKEESGHDCAVDDVYTAEVRLRVSGVRSDEYGQSISFDVLSMDNFEPEDGGDGDEPAGDSGGGDGEKFVGKKTMPKALRYS